MSNRIVNNPGDFQAGMDYQSCAERTGTTIGKFGRGYEAYSKDAQGLQKLRYLLSRVKGGLAELKEFSGELPATAIALRKSIERCVQDYEGKLTAAEEEYAKRMENFVGARSSAKPTP